MNFIQRIISRYMPDPQPAPVWVNEVRIPVPGEVWVFYPNRDSPWPNGNTHEVTVLDVKKDWVRYKYYGKEDRGRIGLFIDMYIPKD